MNVYLFLEDLKNYCETNNIYFNNLSNKDMKYHIKKMLKNICHSSHIKK